MSGLPSPLPGTQVVKFEKKKPFGGMKSQNLPLSLSLSHAGTLEIDSTAPYRSIGLLDTEMGALSYTRERQTACCGEGEVFTRQGIVHVTVRQTNAKNAAAWQCFVW